MKPQASDSIPVPPAGDEVTTEMTQPIIVDLGRKKASKIKDLKAGEGELWEEVLDVITEVKEMLGEDADAKIMLPIILLYEKRSRRQRLEKVLFPLANWDDDDDDDDDED
jgi:hypothetical protein